MATNSGVKDGCSEAVVDEDKIEHMMEFPVRRCERVAVDGFVTMVRVAD